MLIDSKFRDYYDNVMSMGIDRDCVYNRATTYIADDEERIIRGKLTWPSEALRGYIFTAFLIGFCGKIYPIVRVEKIEKDQIKSILMHIYNLDDYHDFLLSNKIKIKFDRHSYLSGLDTTEGIKRFFTQNYLKLETLFTKYKVPIFSIEHEVSPSPTWSYRSILVLNPKLKDFDFVRVKDPFTAFQEIFMFKAGFLGNPEKEIITISDKVKAQQHGHDGKYSFKKMPTNKNKKNEK